MRYILSILTENEPGALSRIIGLFSQRGFNIETITTAPTEDPTMHRMTIQTTGDEHVLEQIQKQLHKLVNVYRVNDLTVGPHVEREIMLVKVAAKNSDVREEVKRCVEIFRGSIVDVTATHYIVQLSGTSEKLDSFLASVRETCNIVEIVRSGIIGLSRSEKTVK
ncbi:acetolactate synthase small subunit [Gilliamella sp. B2776]|uniref:acetolactate synthase small subunit n=1 Tax=unclassified Gilliamella TaxID=2685620 RepID=UPI00226AE455|nr:MULTISPECIES: acetolactate synthase small subunit [unclassified Gilliamella]MCX8650027.1 acetolactate synthase small subunit [Gilliamella sp. B2779]MCX8654960.1 acetolactate synthase small subunit [Gilliamella sp. B2737]MCX8656603.1 acetolactate synthase small subunit [Gilliamella sp. B2894]MCX8665395.1 acetolactate synthase small subunit [Gilliamella sp. B2887]MCX8691800.1 acetolactate synthase small subunit [Gilliamella sp. B2776]